MFLLIVVLLIFANNASATINNTTIRRNKAIYGGAIFATLSPDLKLNNCTIKINTAENGSAIYHSNQTNMFINSCYIVDNNSTTRCAIEVNNSSYTEIINSIIANNASQNANAISFVATNRDQSCNILNSTILGESQDKNIISLQVGFNDVLDVTIANSIIAHQDPSFSKTAIAFNNGTLNFNTSNCYIQGDNILGNTTDNIYEDNVGTVSYGTNYAPQYCAPTLHMGNDIYAYQLSTDFDGNPRIAGPAVDIGAHETQAPCTPMREGLDFDIHILPNPSSGIVFIKTDLEGLNIEVFDFSGKRVFQSADKEMDMSHLPFGIYIIKVENNGTIVKTEKLIKK